MEISNVITILLFILPGMLSEKITHLLDNPTKKEHSDFTITINGILTSLPILFINSILFATFKKVSSLKEFIKLFDNLLFLSIFIIFISITSILFGILKVSTKKLWFNILNYIRGKLGKMATSDGTCWQRFLIDKNEVRYLEVIQNGISNKGFAAIYSTLNEDMSIVLETDKMLYEYDDYDPEELFTKVIGTYIDIEKNVVIKDYDISEYNKWVEEKSREVETTS